MTALKMTLDRKALTTAVSAVASVADKYYGDEIEFSHLSNLGVVLTLKLPLASALCAVFDLGAVIESPFSVPASQLAAALKACKGETVSLAGVYSDSALTAITLVSNAVSAGVPAKALNEANLPQNRKDEVAASVTVGRLRQMLDRVMPCVATDHGRPVLEHILLKMDAQGTLRLISADGYRLAHTVERNAALLKAKGKDDFSASALLYSRDAKALAKALKLHPDDYAVMVSFHEGGNLTFRFGEASLAFDNGSENMRFPDLQHIIPDLKGNGVQSVAFDAQAWKGAYDAVKGISKDINYSTLSPELASVELFVGELQKHKLSGKGKVKFDAQFGLGWDGFSLNPHYLDAAVRAAFPGKRATGTIYLKQDGRPYPIVIMMNEVFPLLEQDFWLIMPFKPAE